MKAIGPAAGEEPATAHLAAGLVDRLAIEAATRDRLRTDAWAAEIQRADPWTERGTHFVLACSTVAWSLTASGDPDAGSVAGYLALRGRELGRVCDLERLEAGGAGFGGPPRWIERGELIASLLASLHTRDAATCDHSRAVGTWSERIAAALDLSPGEQQHVGISGTLHDIGKLATPAEVLAKPGPLDDVEWAVMREHSVAGARVLEKIPSLRPCAPIVRWHHECVDGSGYPDGLCGESIPLAARIVAVADAFHAMISNRPYRRAMGAAQALATLNAGKGTLWDTLVVEAMIGLVRPTFVRPTTRRFAY